METDRGGRRIGAAIALFVVVAFALALFVKGLYPADLPKSRDPDVVENIFANRAVVLSARMLLISAAAVLAFGGVFIVVSIGHRMKKREWLRRAGPFEISERKLSRAEDEIDFWRRTALTNQEEIASLELRLQQSVELISNVETMS